MAHRSSKNSASKVSAAMKTQLALELRAKGASYLDIAKELGYANAGGAWKAVDRGLKKLDATTAETAAKVRQLMLMRLDNWAKRLEVAAGTMKPRDVPRAAQAASRLMETRIRLLGLDKSDLPAGGSEAYRLIVSRMSSD